ncbi:hypothetical protein [Maridesulfovibrio sp. FT414]|uniref:hypothetical protein n=1 Tax=Maridesulfovibrio sp. FT414 TaxID=2979469 RepID=UPI003D80A10F
MLNTVQDCHSAPALKGKGEEAETCFLKSARISWERQSLRGLVLNFIRLGHLRQVQGRTFEAETFYRTAVAVGRKVGQIDCIAVSSYVLGKFNSARQKYDRVQQVLIESLKGFESGRDFRKMVEREFKKITRRSV